MSIENIVKAYKYSDLKGDEIYNSIGKYPVLYSDLKNYNSLEELCPRSSPYQILLLQVSNQLSGHYVAIWINYDENYVYYFDSYGYDSPDTPIKLGLAMFDKMHYPLYFTNLLNKCKKKYLYNPIDYQSKQDIKVSTCGRWSTTAIKCRGLFPNNFDRIFRGNQSKFLSNQDNLITLLTLTSFNDLNDYFK